MCIAVHSLRACRLIVGRIVILPYPLRWDRSRYRHDCRCIERPPSESISRQLSDNSRQQITFREKDRLPGNHLLLQRREQHVCYSGHWIFHHHKRQGATWRLDWHQTKAERGRGKEVEHYLSPEGEGTSEVRTTVDVSREKLSVHEDNGKFTSVVHIWISSFNMSHSVSWH